MIRLLAARCRPDLCRSRPRATLPAGADPQNTLLLDTKHGRIIIKLRNDLAPKHAERIKTWRARSFTTTCRSTA